MVADSCFSWGDRQLSAENKKCEKTVFLVDETGFIGYNDSIVYKKQGCEEKSKHSDVVQRAPKWWDGVRLRCPKMVSELRRR